MAYCSVTDIERASGGRDKLEQLTDHDDEGRVNETYLLTVVADAESMINSYLQHRYLVPIPDLEVPEVIRNLCARETVYILKERREALTAEDEVRHEGRLEWLASANMGRVSPGVDPRLTKSSSVNPTTGTRESGDLTLTRAKFGVFT